MVSLISLQAFFGLAVVLTGVLYLVHRRTAYGSALLAAIGAAILALYLTVAITISLVDIV
jgi:hypothetical protein